VKHETVLFSGICFMQQTAPAGSNQILVIVIWGSADLNEQPMGAGFAQN
jgi:hypothetical protein